MLRDSRLNDEIRLVHPATLQQDPQTVMRRLDPPTPTDPASSAAKRLLDPVIVMLKRRTSVMRRIDEHALDLPRELLLQRFQRQQVVPEVQSVVERIRCRDSRRRVVRPCWILEQTARRYGRIRFAAFACFPLSSIRACSSGAGR